jgi:hypothetical protein
MKCVSSVSRLVVDHYQMVIDMSEERLDSIKPLAQFLALIAVLSTRVFGGGAEHRCYVKHVLSRFDYPHLCRPDKLLRRQLQHITG